MQPAFTFCTPTRIEFGFGSSERVGSEAKSQSASRALVVTDPGIRSSGILDAIVAHLEAAGVAAIVFDDVAANPRDTSVVAGEQRAREESCEVIVGVGGGSAMDCAKAISVVLALGGTVQDYVEELDAPSKIPGPATPLIAIPTTAGTGSEATFWAVITDSSSGRKKALGDPLCAPRVALVDPELTVSLPPLLTATTGVDALTHAIEAYAAPCGTPVSESVAASAIRLVSQNLRQAYADGANKEARANMMLASLLAGIALGNSSTGGVHAMAETIGGVYDAPHGAAIAAYLSVVMDFNLLAVPDKFAQIAELMGEGIRGLSVIAAARKAPAAVRSLVADLDLPNAKALGVGDDDLPELARGAAANLSTLGNARPVGEADYLALYRLAQSQ